MTTEVHGITIGTAERLYGMSAIQERFRASQSPALGLTQIGSGVWARHPERTKVAAKSQSGANTVRIQGTSSPQTRAIEAKSIQRHTMRAEYLRLLNLQASIESENSTKR